MNLILMQAGYVPVIINTNSKAEYLLALEQADAGEEEDFIMLIGNNLLYSLELFYKGAKGESIEDVGDIDKRIALLQKRMELEHPIGSKLKDKPTQELLIDGLMLDLTKGLFVQLKKFERFFNTFSCELYNKYDGQYRSVAKIKMQDEIAEHLEVIKHSGKVLDRYQC